MSARPCRLAGRMADAAMYEFHKGRGEFVYVGVMGVDGIGRARQGGVRRAIGCSPIGGR